MKMSFELEAARKARVGSLTGNLHHVTGDDLSGLDPLHALPVRPVNFAHLGLVLLQRLDGTLCVALLLHGRISKKKTNIRVMCAL